MVIDYRKIISSSWEFTQKHKSLIMWYGFFPSLLITIVDVVYVLYQYLAFSSSELLGNGNTESFWEKSYIFFNNIFHNNTELGITLVIFIIIAAAAYFLLPTLFQGGLIQLIARLHNNQEVRTINGLYYGLICFLPLFEYHLIARGLSSFTFITEISFVARNLGWDWFKILMLLFILFILVGFLLSIVFTYTEYFIVIDKIGVFSAIAESCRLVLRHWQETFLILVIMAIIGLQIIVRLAIVIILPSIIIFSTAYLASFTLLKTIGLYIGLGIGLIALFFAAYLRATITVFATTVWTDIFLKLTSHEETSARESDVEALKPKV